MVLVLCALSVGVWLTSGSVVVSLAGYICAAWLSAWPQAKDYINNPTAARASAWVWQVSIIAMILTLASKFVTNEVGPEHTLLYSALMLMNIVMSLLCMRKTRA